MADDDKRRREEGGLPRPSEPHRDNVPSDWEHGGEVDQFEAALVQGAGGVPADDDELAEDAYDDADDSAARAFGDTDAGGAAATVPARPTHRGATAPGAPTTGRGPRFAQFLRASWAELQRVQWPNRQQVAQATAVVLGFVIIAGAYLGLADVVAQEIIDLII